MLRITAFRFRFLEISKTLRIRDEKPSWAPGDSGNFSSVPDGSQKVISLSFSFSRVTVVSCEVCDLLAPHWE